MNVKDIKTVEDAKRYAECPTVTELKCCECGCKKPYDKKIPYAEQRDCPKCDSQMLGTEWGGWYNRWRNLALHFIEN